MAVGPLRRLVRRLRVSAGPVSLESPRLILRPAGLDDFTEWSVLRRENREFLQPWEPRWPRDHLTLPSFRRRVRWSRRQARSGRAHAFLLVLKDSGAVIGGATLSNIRGHPSRNCTLGYWIGEAHARQGLTSEAVERVVEFAFRDLHLMRVEAACLETNAASRALLLRCGFSYEGIARSYLEVDGRVSDHLLYARVATGE